MGGGPGVMTRTTANTVVLYEKGQTLMILIAWGVESQWRVWSGGHMPQQTGVPSSSKLRESTVTVTFIIEREVAQYTLIIPQFLAGVPFSALCMQ